MSLLIIFASCEAEKDFAENSKMIVRRFSMQEMSKKGDDKLVATVNKIKSLQRDQSNENNKIVYDMKAGLYFDDEKGLFIQDGEKMSYTFPVIRESPSEKVQNICFNKNKAGDYDVYLVKYDYTKEQAHTMTDEQLKEAEKEFVTLLKDGQVVNLFKYVCIDVVVTVTHTIAVPIDNGDLTGNFGYTTATFTTTVTIASGCFFTYDNGGSGGVGDGSGGGPGDSSGPGLGDGTGGVSSGNDGPIITGSLIDDTEAPVAGFLPLGWALQYYQEGLDEFMLPLFLQYPQFRDILATNNCNYSSREFVTSALNAVYWYQQEHGNTNEVNEYITDFLNSVAYDDPNATDTGVTLPMPPSCESFDFKSTASNWQESAVKNIHFTVVVLSPNGAYVNHVVEFANAVLFGMPKNIQIGNTNVTAGVAATVSANILALSMRETVAKYGNKPVSGLIVDLYFESRLKHNFQNSVPGGRVNMHPQNYTVPPTQYQTNAQGTGNCM